MFKKKKDAAITNYHRDLRSGSTQSMDWVYIKPNPSRRRFARHYNAYASKVVDAVVEAALAKRFTIDGVSDKLLSDLQDIFWEPLEELGKNERECGIGILIGYEKGREDEEDLKDTPGKITAFFAPDPNQCFPVKPPVKIMDLYDTGPWLWDGVKVHPDRMVFFQTLPDPEKHDVNGWATLDAAWLGIFALEKLSVGSLNRAQIWAVKEILHRVAGSGGLLTTPTQLDRVTDSVLREYAIHVDDKESYVWLEDPVGAGKELEDLAVHWITARTGIPQTILFGNREGGVQGSETDLTLWGDTVSRFQSQLVTPVKRILEMLGVTFQTTNLDWDVEFYTSPERQLKLRMMELQVKAMEENPDLATNTMIPATRMIKGGE